MSELEAFLGQAFAAAERIAVVGVGAELCRDDAAGLYLIDRLAMRTGFAVGKASGRLLLVGGGPAPENFTGLIKAFVGPICSSLSTRRIWSCRRGRYKSCRRSKPRGFRFPRTCCRCQ